MIVRASLFALLADGRTVERPRPGAAPSAFRIWAAGPNRTDHGVHVFTERSAVALMAAQAARGNVYSIDVDHLSFSKEAPPDARAAVGWMRIEARKDETGRSELWAVDVEWSTSVRAGLEADPPTWRYFSPAYRADPKTGEILAYLNTAITNNPATWGVTALAAMGTEGDTRMTIEEIKAALQALADAGDETAKRMLGAMAEPPKIETSTEDPPKAETEKASAGEDEAPAVAASALGIVQILASRVAKLEALNVASERAGLIASRPDLAAEVIAILAAASTPLDVVRAAVTTIKRAAVSPAAAAGVAVLASRGAGQVDGPSSSDRLPPSEAADLDRRMGLGSAGKAIDDRGSVVVFSAVRPPSVKGGGQ